MLIAVPIIVIAALLVCVAVSIWRYGSRNEIVDADAALVLGITIRSDLPSPALRERVNHGIELYRKGRVRKIIISGGRRYPWCANEAVVAMQYALTQGVPECDILTESESRITEQNFRYARELAKREHLKTFIVVSDPLHMKRAMLMARDYGFDAHPSPTPTTAFRTMCPKLVFLASEVIFYTFYVLKRPFSRPCG